MKRKYYVYLLIDPRDNVPFYTGKGHGSRMYSHTSEAKRPQHRWTNVLKCERILSILSDNYTPESRIVSRDLTENQAFLQERTLIEKYGRIIDHTGTLTNIRTSHYQSHLTIPERKYKSRSVCQYTPDGVLLTIFPSASAAAASINKHNTGILNTCHGKRYSAHGFVWKFEEDEFIPPPKEIKYHCNRRKPVIQQDLDGKVVNKFQSMKEAAIKTNINHSNICSCCTGNAKTAGGYIWLYEDT